MGYRLPVACTLFPGTGKNPASPITGSMFNIQGLETGNRQPETKKAPRLFAECLQNVSHSGTIEIGTRKLFVFQ